MNRRNILKVTAGGVAVAATRKLIQPGAEPAHLPIELTCEYLTCPLGVEEPHPRLSWINRSDRRGMRQTAWQVLVSEHKQKLLPGLAEMWDSGRVSSDQSALNAYAGKPLQSGRRYWWRVRTWDEQHRAGEWSQPAYWEMGLLKESDWQPAKWIGFGAGVHPSATAARPVQTATMHQPKMVKSFVSPLLRRNVDIAKPIIRARMYVCGVGYCCLFINNKRVGHARLDPAMTTYDVRSFYVVHDVTDHLHHGTNTIGAALGNGFFGQNLAFNDPGLAWGPPRMIAKCVIEFADGTIDVVATDSTWKVSTGPVLFDNVYAGETYDARLEIPNWGSPTFDDSSWAQARLMKNPTHRLQSQMIQPIATRQIITAKKIIASSHGKWIVDLGQNFAGTVRIKVHEPAGTQLTLRFAEILAPGGTQIDPSTTGVFANGFVQTAIYICPGGPAEWEPQFSYHGFRYVEVTGLRNMPGNDFLIGMQLLTAMPQRGGFSCSDESLNAIYRNSVWTIESNIHSITEDCPTREKCSWMGDLHIVAVATIYNLCAAPLLTKMTEDIDTTLGRGVRTPWGIPASPGLPCNIAAGRRLCDQANPDWGATIVLTPWLIYLYYGDLQPLRRQYAHMKKWVLFVSSSAVSEKDIVKYGFGDWCPPGVDGRNPKCPVQLSSTALQYACLVVMHKTARLLNIPEDAATFERMAAQVKAAFNQKFFRPAAGGYGSQTSNAMALHYGLVPEGREQLVIAALNKEIMAKDDHADTGIFGSRALYTVLNQYGYDDLTYRMMKRRSYPSYLYMIERGDTTWPEIQFKAPDELQKMHCSWNHAMQSCFSAWFHESIGGISPCESNPGFKKFALRPHNFQQLSQAKVFHETMYGTIHSQWRTNGRYFHWTVTVPANTSARVAVPATSRQSVRESGTPIASNNAHIKFVSFDNARAIFDVAAGTYHFESDT